MPFSCLDSWWTGGQCLLGHLTIPVNVGNKAEASRWSSHWASKTALNGNFKRHSWLHRESFSSLGCSKYQWAHDQKSLPNIRRASQFHTKAVAGQQWSFDSLANCVALDYWTRRHLCNGKHHLLHLDKLHKIGEQVHWLQQISPDLPGPLFSRLPSNLGYGLKPLYKLDLSCYF